MEQINVNNQNFAFVNVNRSVANQQLKKNIREYGRVLMPIMVVSADDINLDGYIFIDPRTGNEYSSLSQDTLIVLDGQHRLTSVFEINKEEDNKHTKSAEQYEKWSKKKEGEEPSIYEPHHIEYIPCVRLTKEQVGDNINDFIININSTMKNWKDGDYIANAAKLHKGDELIDAVKFFSDKKFSFSTISRYICFSNNALKASELNDYAEGKKTIASTNAKRGRDIYEKLHAVGFRDVFLKKRYIIDHIISKKLLGDNEYEHCLSRIAGLSTEKVHQIEQFTSDDFINDKLDALLNAKDGSVA